MSSSSETIITEKSDDFAILCLFCCALINVLQLFVTPLIAKRMVAAVLLICGKSPSQVCEATGMGRSTAYYLKARLKACKSSADFEALFFIQKGRGRRPSLITAAEIEVAIVQEIESRAYFTYQQIADMIKEKFQIAMSIASVRRLMLMNGIRKLKCGSLPAKADVKAQRIFYENILHPLMEKAKAGSIELLFLDASHFVMGGDFLGSVYGKGRRFCKTFSGRIRYNVLGALNFNNKKVHTVTNDKYITATEICAMLQILASVYPNKELYIVLDNARYQRCQIVTDLAKKLNINLVYVPPYSPNLNLIERLWKFVKGELRCKYYSSFTDFVTSIDNTIDSTSTINKERIDSLISEKVQLYDDLEPITENMYTEKNDSEPAA